MPTTSNNPKPTWHHWWMTITGRIFIAPDEVGVVYRNERFHRLLPTGYHPHPSRWNERLPGCIRIKADTFLFTVEISSRDGFALQGELNVHFLFNPLEAHPDEQPFVAAIGLSKNKQAILQDIVRRAASVSLSQFAAAHDAIELLKGRTRIILERRIKHELNNVLRSKGIVIASENGVIINAITPPADMAQTHLQVHHREVLLDMIKRFSPELRALDILMQLAQKQGVSLQVVDSQLWAMLGQMYQTAGISPLPTTIHLNGQQPARAEVAAPQNGHAEA
ncbi:MAG: hypothetical protein Fur0021_31950 [Candidatus Promineifilaceae bacterium]